MHLDKSYIFVIIASIIRMEVGNQLWLYFLIRLLGGSLLLY